MVCTAQRFPEDVGLGEPVGHGIPSQDAVLTYTPWRKKSSAAIFSALDNFRRLP